jgi:hypothetical protein
MNKLLLMALTVSVPAFASLPGVALGIMGIPCAPEVAEGNLNGSERVLMELSEQPEFSEATKFKAFLSELATKAEGSEEKFMLMTEAIGVNGKDVDAVMNFIGARSYDVYVEHVMKNLELSKEQANLLVTNLSNSLKGNVEKR